MFNSFQNTGYNPNYGVPNQQQQQQQQQSLYTQPTGFGQPNLYASSQPTGYVQTQPTGFQGAPTVVENHDLKIPPFRLSFITVDDQKKFEHLFRTAVPRGEQAISGDSASTILMRSGLSPVTLAEIWTLSDIDKTGSLLFPEFALSLHLCNTAKRGEPLPGVLPEKWLNEVKSFMDAINFSIPDDPNKILANTPFAKKDDWMYNQPSMNTQATGFNQPPTTFAPQATGFGNSFAPQATGFNQQSQTSSFNQQPQNNWVAPQLTGYNQQPQPSTSFGGGGGIGGSVTGEFVPLQPQQTAGLIQKTGPLQAQGTGFNQLPQQRTGGFAPQSTGIEPQRTGGLVPQTTGFQQTSGGFNTLGLQPQRTGPLQANRTGPAPLQSQPTGPLQQQQTGALQPQPTGFLQQQPTGYLQAQPTGRPGEWGFVNMPTGGYSGLNTMHKVFQPNTNQNFQDLNKVMSNNAATNVTWAITKQEKQVYDNLFQAWDTGRRGYVDSNVALNVFTKSGLSRSDLEAIWTLADTDDAGKLNKNQFAVAMHLIYRRLNGLEIPLRLPPELIPPAERTLKDTMDNLKNSLKNNGGLKSAKSYKPQTKVDGARFKNDDDNFGYVSRARHKSRDQGSPSASNEKDKNLTIDELKKSIKEKKILLDALDVEDEEKQHNDTSAIDKLKSQIFDLQTKITSQAPNNNNKNLWLQKLNHLTRDKIPKLISNINQVNQEISEKSIELVKLKLRQEDPSWDDKNVDLNAVSNDYGKFDLKQKMALLTGKGGSGGSDFKFKEAVQKSKSEFKGQSDMVKDIEAGIRTMEDECASKLKTSSRVEVGYEKWEKGFGISQTVASFVRELQRYQDDATAKAQPVAKPVPQSNNNGPQPQQEQVNSTKVSAVNSSSAEPRAAYSTPEERAAYIKAEAEKRMAARLEKLGISRHKNSGKRSTEKPTPAAVQSKPVQDDRNVKQEENMNNAPQLVKQKTGAPEVNKVEGIVHSPAQSSAEELRNDRDVVAHPQPIPQQSASSRPAQPQLVQPARSTQPRQAQEVQSSVPGQSAALDSSNSDQHENNEATKENFGVAAPVAAGGTEDHASGKSRSLAGPTDSSPEVKASSKPIATSVAPEHASSKDAPATNAPKYEDVNNAPPSFDAGHNGNEYGKVPGDREAASQPEEHSRPPRHDNNPFFKKQFQQVNTEKANMQRNFQRGISNDNSWSDSEEEDSDDDAPNRADALKLANSLFGGMAPPSSVPTSESLSTPTQARKGETTSQLQAEPGTAAITEPTVNKKPLEDSSTGSSGAGWNTAESSPGINAENGAEAVPPIPPIPPIPSSSTLPPPPPALESDAPASSSQSFAAEEEFESSSAVPPPPPDFAPPVPPSDSISSPPPAPPVPSFDATPAPAAPPPPPPPAPPVPSFGAPAAPPPPPPPAAAAQSASLSGGAPSTPNIGALLSQITGGKSLKKVETKESTGATVGRVL
ncbi:hypothetical protein KGF57_003318 [Candida theae]|uniref:Actin cytoskeleton-regulatory complex protein PAN1 n=1 Tax=Candida theae TaxID=1198502 RepID=A0AAD5FY52_9ASCO|nr:uncharacterized protein KGF57_003318 [Candida theae]KAI5957624.1 hypothetical protein KGF57_003318 [Candida theae]